MTVVINGTSGYIADFSNATVASRQAFQTSTANGSTGIYALPNGTSTAASWQATNAADPTNASKILIATNGSTDVQLVSGRNGTGTYLPLTFYTNGSEQMRLDTSGNLGLGVTPSAWQNTFKAIQIGGSAAVSNYGTSEAALTANAYYASSQWRYINNDVAMRYVMNAGGHQFQLGATGTTGNVIGFTTAMTLDASGNLGVGTTSPYVPSGSTQRTIEASSTGLVGSFYATANQISTVRALLAANSFDSTTYTGSVTNHPFLFLINNTERARIDTSGNFYVGGASGGKRANFIGPATVDITYTETNSAVTWNAGPIATGSGRFNWYNATASSDRMYLTTAGALYNSTGTYGTISDVSLKENIVDATPKLDDVMRLRVRNYNMKSDPDKKKVIGVVAQEIEEVFPGLVEETVNRVALENGSFDETTVKAVKYSVLTTILVKAIQEQQAIITQLQADVAALKGKA